jgi:hypothetical protein
MLGEYAFSQHLREKEDQAAVIWTESMFGPPLAFAVMRRVLLPAASVWIAEGDIVFARAGNVDRPLNVAANAVEDDIAAAGIATCGGLDRPRWRACRFQPDRSSRRLLAWA